MKKAILIITNPGKEGADNYCEGVYKDADNYKDFFQSEVGGEWYQDEITLLDRPKKETVMKTLQGWDAYEYSIIIFSGHGYFSKNDNETVIECQPGKTGDSTDEDLIISRLCNNGKRLIILDCCRKPLDILLHEEAQANFSIITKSMRSTRAEYESIIRKCDRMNIIGYGCGIGEAAGDSSSSGGYYTYSLLQGAKQFGKEMEKGRYASFPSVHTRASKIINKLRGSTQHPQIEKPRDGKYFPFVIK